MDAAVTRQMRETFDVSSVNRTARGSVLEVTCRQHKVLWRYVIAGAAALGLPMAVAGGQLRTAAARARPRLMVQAGPYGVARTVVFSPDGRRAATTNYGGIRVWDLASGKVLRRITRTRDLHAFSPDGRMLLGRGVGGRMEIWDAGTGRTRRVFGREAGPHVDGAWSPDGRAIASADDDAWIRIWNAGTGRLRRRFPCPGRDVMNVAFSPDGRLLATGAAGERADGIRFGEIALWELATGRRVARRTVGLLRSLAFCGDGRRVVSLAWGLETDPRERVSGYKWLSSWQVPTLKSADSTQLDAGEYLALSSDGHTAALAEGGGGPAVALFDVGSHRALKSLGTSILRIYGVGFTPDGKTVAGASDDGNVRLWDVATGARRQTLTGRADNVSEFVVSPDGRHLAVVADTPDMRELIKGEFGGFFTAASRVKVWDLAGREGARTLPDAPGQITCLAFAPYSDDLAIGTRRGVLSVWSIRRRREMLRLHTPPPPKGRESSTYFGDLPDGIASVAFGPAGRQLASRAYDGRLTVWELASGRPKFTVWSDGNGPTFAGTGTVLAIRKGRLAAWNTRTGGPRPLPARRRGPKIVAFLVSPDGSDIFAGDAAGRIHRWKLTTGREQAPLRGPGGAVTPMALSPAYGGPAGGPLLVTEQRGSTASLWDLPRARIAQTLRKVPQDFSDFYGEIAFHPRRPLLLSVREDNGIELWSLAHGAARPLCRLYTFTDGSWAVLDRRGHYDASNPGDMAGLDWVVGKRPVPLGQFARGHFMPGLLSRALRGGSPGHLEANDAATSAPPGRAGVMRSERRQRGGGG